jgi:hypothetical protein
MGYRNYAEEFERETLSLAATVRCGAQTSREVMACIRADAR